MATLAFVEVANYLCNHWKSPFQGLAGPLSATMIFNDRVM